MWLLSPKRSTSYSGSQVVTTQTCLINFPASPFSNGAHPATHIEEQPLKARIHVRQESLSVTYRSYNAQGCPILEIWEAANQVLSVFQFQLNFFYYLVNITDFPFPAPSFLLPLFLLLLLFFSSSISFYLQPRLTIYLTTKPLGPYKKLKSLVCIL